jgi:hypothetical protein
MDHMKPKKEMVKHHRYWPSPDGETPHDTSYADDIHDVLKTDLWAQTDICKRIGRDEVFAQHVYAALCNQQFIRVEEWELTTGADSIKVSYSWRKAAEIIALIRNEFYNKTENPDVIETYVHWYCSGMGCLEGAVEEGVVTDEVRDIFRNMGWSPIAHPDEWGV